MIAMMTDYPEPGSLSLEEELAAYHAAGWTLEEAFWPGKEKPKYHFTAPDGSVFNSNVLLHGAHWPCDEVTEFSSTALIEADRAARRLLILQMAYKKQYGDFFRVIRATPEQWEASAWHF